MRLAASSRQTIEGFFKDYFNDESFRLPEIRFYAGKFTRILTGLMKIHGITIGEKVFIAPHLLFVNSNLQNALPDDLAVHEIMHVLQYQSEGFWRFLYKYLSEYRRNLKGKKSYDLSARSSAYWAISYEREARDAAAKFVNWKNKTREKSQNRQNNK